LISLFDIVKFRRVSFTGVNFRNTNRSEISRLEAVVTSSRNTWLVLLT